MNEVAYAVEGWADEPVAAKLIAAVGCLPHRILTAGGKSNLDPKIPGYNASARYRPWLVLRDLDQDDEKECIPEILVRLAAGQLSRCFALRLPVRATEAWILADATAFSTFFHVPAAMVPADPDTLRQPKSALVDACRASRSRDIRTAMVPRPPSGRPVGPEYSATIRHFAETEWDLTRASQASPSLRNSLTCLERLVSTGAW